MSLRLGAGRPSRSDCALRLGELTLRRCGDRPRASSKYIGEGDGERLRSERRGGRGLADPGMYTPVQAGGGDVAEYGCVKTGRR